MSAAETLTETVTRVMGDFYRPTGGITVPQPETNNLRHCPICDATVIHLDGCAGILDPTLPATIGSNLEQTANELETCWRALGQVNPNRCVTAARLAIAGAIKKGGR